MKKSAQQLIEETRKRMEQLYEYSFYSHGTYEDGEQAPADPVAAGGDPAAMGAPADPMAGGDPAAAVPTQLLLAVTQLLWVPLLTQWLVV